MTDATSTNRVSPLAITRDVSCAIVNCELTHLDREPIDITRARRQHHAYEQVLESLGCEVRRIPAAADMPDSVFIEDTAVVLPELAVITRPGAESRRRELAAVVDALAPLRRLVHIAAPGTLDGGDVLVLGRAVFVGRSTRTNDAGIQQLRNALAPGGYSVTAVEASDCLHLKSAVTALHAGAVLMNPAWVSRAVFSAFEQVDVDAREPGAANVVAVGGRLVSAAAFPRTRDRLAARGFDVLTVDVSEIAKAEGALTCCSLIVL
jgi:dimethylargininase